MVCTVYGMYGMYGIVCGIVYTVRDIVWCVCGRVCVVYVWFVACSVYGVCVHTIVCSVCNVMYVLCSVHGVVCSMCVCVVYRVWCVWCSV